MVWLFFFKKIYKKIKILMCRITNTAHPFDSHAYPLVFYEKMEGEETFAIFECFDSRAWLLTYDSSL